MAMNDDVVSFDEDSSLVVPSVAPAPASSSSFEDIGAIAGAAVAAVIAETLTQHALATVSESPSRGLLIVDSLARATLGGFAAKYIAGDAAGAAFAGASLYSLFDDFFGGTSAPEESGE